MIEAVCDKCGKRIVLEHDEVGLKSPKGWKTVLASCCTSEGSEFRMRRYGTGQGCTNGHI